MNRFERHMRNTAFAADQLRLVEHNKRMERGCLVCGQALPGLVCPDCYVCVHCTPKCYECAG